MKIKKMPIDKINTSDYNPRKDLKPGDRDYEKIKKSLKAFGLVEPLVVNIRDGKNKLVGGHQRLKILKELGETAVEFSCVDLDEKKERALAVALNKVNGEWDKDKLVDLLSSMEVEDLCLTGFEMSEVTKLIGQPEQAFELEDFIYENQRAPAWFVVRCDLLDYEVVRAHLNSLDISGIVITDSQQEGGSA